MTHFTKTLRNNKVVTLTGAAGICSLTNDFVTGLLKAGYKITKPTPEEVEAGVIVIGVDYITGVPVHLSRFKVELGAVDHTVFAVHSGYNPFIGMYFVTRTLAECYFENITADKEPEDHDSGGRLFGELIQFLDK